MSNEKHQLLLEMRDTIINYLQEEVERDRKALETYEEKPFQGSDAELDRMREMEAIKLRALINQNLSHISVIKKMFPDKKK